jgi:hypothetical protein
MKTMSVSQFADHHGVSRQSVYSWKRDGWLVIVKEKIDVVASDKKLKGARLGKFAASKEAPAEHQPAEPDVEINDSEPISKAAARMLASGDVRLLSKADAETLKENYLAQLRKLEYDQKSGALVELEVAQNVLFECARVARDAWLNWPAKAAPYIAADLGVDSDKVIDVLTAHVHRQVEELGDPEGRFAG